MDRRAFLASSATALAEPRQPPHRDERGASPGHQLDTAQEHDDRRAASLPALLANDVGETANLAPSQPARVKKLAATLGGYLRSVEAQMPTDTRTGKTVEWPDRI